MSKSLKKKNWKICKKLENDNKGLKNGRENTAKIIKKILVLSNICWNFEKKLEEHTEKLTGNLKLFETWLNYEYTLWKFYKTENFLEILGELVKFYRDPD